jgi:hypothetical protein
VTPAAHAHITDGHRKLPRTRGCPAPPAEQLIPHVPAVPPQRRGIHSQACHTHAHARTHTCAKMLCRWDWQTTLARAHERTPAQTHARTRMRAHTNARTNTQTNSHGHHTSAWTLPHTRRQIQRHPDTHRLAHTRARARMLCVCAHVCVCSLCVCVGLSTRTCARARMCLCLCLCVCVCVCAPRVTLVPPW